MCIHRISTVGYRVVNVNGACNRSDTDGCSRRMPLCILVVSSVPRSYTTIRFPYEKIPHEVAREETLRLSQSRVSYHWRA